MKMVRGRFKGVVSAEPKSARPAFGPLSCAPPPCGFQRDEREWADGTVVKYGTSGVVYFW